MNEAIKVRKAQVRPIVEATFPEYRGRTFEVRFQESVTLHDVNWGGGTRNYYRVLTRDGRVGGLASFAPWDRRNQEGERIALDENTVVVSHTIFCGQDCGITIYAHPALQTAMLNSGK